MNLYGFVENDGVSRFDILGLAVTSTTGGLNSTEVDNTCYWDIYLGHGVSALDWLRKKDFQNRGPCSKLGVRSCFDRYINRLVPEKARIPGLLDFLDAWDDLYDSDVSDKAKKMVEEAFRDKGFEPPSDPNQFQFSVVDYGDDKLFVDRVLDLARNSCASVRKEPCCCKSISIHIECGRDTEVDHMFKIIPGMRKQMFDAFNAKFPQGGGEKDWDDFERGFADQFREQAMKTDGWLCGKTFVIECDQ